MAVNREQQQKVLTKVREILSTYHTRDAVKIELESRGFTIRAEHGDVVSLENTPAEIFVQLFVTDRGYIVATHVVTFEEIELRPPAKE